jgi:hypothetical protein
MGQSPDPLRELVLQAPDLAPERAAALAAQAASVTPASVQPAAPAVATGFSVSTAMAATFAFMPAKPSTPPPPSPHVSLDTSDSEGLGQSLLLGRYIFFYVIFFISIIL